MNSPELEDVVAPNGLCVHLFSYWCKRRNNYDREKNKDVKYFSGEEKLSFGMFINDNLTGYVN